MIINYSVLCSNAAKITPDEFEKIGPRFCPEIVAHLDRTNFCRFVREVILYGNHKMLNYLVTHYPDVKRNIDDSEGELLVHSILVKNVDKAMKCTKILLNAGANVSLKHRAFTILQLSVLENVPAPLIKLLLVYGATFGEFAHFCRELSEELELKSKEVQKLRIEMGQEVAWVAQFILAIKSKESPIAGIPSELSKKIFDCACDLFS